MIAKFPDKTKTITQKLAKVRWFLLTQKDQIWYKKIS
jgi:hypothetical protein